MALKRLNKELDDMRKNIPEIYESVEVDDDIFDWQAIFLKLGSYVSADIWPPAGS
jgi:hypothetical protein